MFDIIIKSWFDHMLKSPITNICINIGISIWNRPSFQTHSLWFGRFFFRWKTKKIKISGSCVDPFRKNGRSIFPEKLNKSLCLYLRNGMPDFKHMYIVGYAIKIIYRATKEGAPGVPWAHPPYKKNGSKLSTSSFGRIFFHKSDLGWSAPTKKNLGP